MEKAIWKYELEMNGRQWIEMPRDAEIISIQKIDGIVCLFAIVESDSDKVKNIVEVYNTGEVLPDLSTRLYLGTVHYGASVFHLFMVL